MKALGDGVVLAYGGAPRAAAAGDRARPRDPSDRLGGAVVGEPRVARGARQEGHEPPRTLVRFMGTTLLGHFLTPSTSSLKRLAPTKKPASQVHVCVRREDQPLSAVRLLRRPSDAEVGSRIRSSGRLPPWPPHGRTFPRGVACSLRTLCEHDPDGCRSYAVRSRPRRLTREQTAGKFVPPGVPPALFRLGGLAAIALLEPNLVTLSGRTRRSRKPFRGRFLRRGFESLPLRFSADPPWLQGISLVGNRGLGRSV